MSPNMQMDATYGQLWRESIQESLETALLNTLQGIRARNISFTMSCLMAGKTQNDLRPSIVVFCNAEALRKQVYSKIKRFEFVRDSGFQCLIVVGEAEDLSDAEVIALIVLLSCGFLILLPVVWLVSARRRARSVRSQSPEPVHQDDDNTGITQLSPYPSHEPNTGDVVTPPAYHRTSPSLKNSQSRTSLLPLEESTLDYPVEVRYEHIVMCGCLLSVLISTDTAMRCTLGGLMNVGGVTHGVTSGHIPITRKSVQNLNFKSEDASSESHSATGAASHEEPEMPAFVEFEDCINTKPSSSADSLDIEVGETDVPWSGSDMATKARISKPQYKNPTRGQFHKFATVGPQISELLRVPF